MLQRATWFHHDTVYPKSGEQMAKPDHTQCSHNWGKTKPKSTKDAASLVKLPQSQLPASTTTHSKSTGTWSSAPWCVEPISDDCQSTGQGIEQSEQWGDNGHPRTGLALMKFPLGGKQNPCNCVNLPMALRANCSSDSMLCMAVTQYHMWNDPQIGMTVPGIRWLMTIHWLP